MDSQSTPQLILTPEKKIIYNEPKLISVEDEIKRHVGEALRSKKPMDPSLLSMLMGSK